MLAAAAKTRTLATCAHPELRFANRAIAATNKSGEASIIAITATIGCVDQMPNTAAISVMASIKLNSENRGMNTFTTGPWQSSDSLNHCNFDLLARRQAYTRDTPEIRTPESSRP